MKQVFVTLLFFVCVYSLNAQTTTNQSVKPQEITPIIKSNSATIENKTLSSDAVGAMSPVDTTNMDPKDKLVFKYLAPNQIMKTEDFENKVRSSENK